MKSEFYTDHGGLSMTSAQHLSNLAKEVARDASNRLKSPEFFGTTIRLLGATTEPTVMSIGMTDSGLDKLSEDIEVVSKMNSFIAYFAEARKDKEKTLRDIKNMSITTWIECTGGQYPESLDYQEWLKSQGLTEKVLDREFPVSPAETETSEKILAQKNLGLTEYQEFLELEATSAVIGQFVHSSEAPLVVARDRMLEKLEKPLKKEGDGRETVIYEYTPSVTIEKLEQVFAGFQRSYREVQKKLNKIKYDLLEAEATRFATETEEYRRKLQEYSEERKQVDDYNVSLCEKHRLYRAEVREARRLLESKFESWRVSERERVSKLMFVIPPELVDTWKFLENYGSEKQEA